MSSHGLAVTLSSIRAMQERTVEVMGIINRFNVVGREDRILQKQIPESSDKTFLFSPGTVNFLAL